MYVSGFPKKACQGCHISEGAGRIIFQLVSFYALGSKSMETKVKCFVNTIRELFPSRHFVLTHSCWRPSVQFYPNLMRERYLQKVGISGGKRKDQNTDRMFRKPGAATTSYIRNNAHKNAGQETPFPSTILNVGLSDGRDGWTEGERRNVKTVLSN